MPIFVESEEVEVEQGRRREKFFAFSVPFRSDKLESHLTRSDLAQPISFNVQGSC